MTDNSILGTVAIQVQKASLFQEEPMSLNPTTLLQIALRVGGAIVVFLVGRWLAGRVRTSLKQALAKTAVPPSMTRLILLGSFYGIMLITIIVALALIGFPIEALLTASLVIVVVLGFALQQSLANLAATIMFMLFQPFRLGELIDTNGVMGTVKELQFFSTVLVTGDNKEITIPNAKIQGANLVNYSRLGTLREDFVFPISYGDDVEKAKSLLGQLLAADARVLADPAPLIFVQSLEASGPRIAVRPWVKSDDYFPLQFDFPEQVKRCFDAEGIRLPSPTYDVRLNGQKAT
jgi:small conductance mechanosensitive channel